MLCQYRQPGSAPSRQATAAGATACCATPEPVRVEVIQYNRFNSERKATCIALVDTADLIRDSTLAPTHVARGGDST
jgi:hypothetical protein